VEHEELLCVLCVFVVRVISENMSNNFLGLRNVPLKDARFVILPLPYDITTSYIKGTAKGPSAILKASINVETFDEEFGIDTTQDSPVHTCPAPPLDFRARPEKFIPALNKYLGALIKRLSPKQTLICLGGEHSISYPIVNAYQKTRSRNFSVLHLDAHSDLRHEYDGSIYSHACVMKRIYDAGVESIVQVGIRNLTENCLGLIKEGRKTNDKGRRKLTTYFAHEHSGYQIIGGEILDKLADDVYVTIDLDVFDPSVMPAVGTPEPGGLGWYEVLDVLRPVFRHKRIIGFDVVELCPIKGSIYSDFTAAKLIYRLMGCLAYSTAARRPSNYHKKQTS
jgi:agmatinase